VTNAPFAFESEPYRTELPTRVVETGTEGRRPFVILSETIFYPEGGGQPADRGEIEGEAVAAVVDVQKKEGSVRHYLDRPLAAGPATARLDWVRRFDHMQQHTGQHLLTAVAADRFRWETTAFHMGAELCDIEVDAAPLSVPDLASLEEAVVAEIRVARPVTARRVEAAELERLSIRTRGLPEGHTGDVRLVEIAGIDVNTCGGTHLRSTAEIEAIKLLDTEAIRGGTRLFFAAGGRVRRRLEAHEVRNATLRSVLGAPDVGLVAAAEAKLEQLQGAQRRARGLEEELIAALVDSAAKTPGAAFVRRFDGKGGDFLQRLARHLTAAAPLKTVLLASTDGEEHLFALGLGNKVDEDVQRIGKEVVALLGGRGGGSGRVFQGKAPSLARFAEAERLVEKVAGGN
jgi:alanyl-tRNA synthetase